ncbi:hypothetical protein [Kineococcus esterisolvens]|uniref:hypothetical protein n=1 Tax=unclassified Kineococcus TaxID=2621656 RepID=UPI003D7ED5E7
MSAHSAPPVHNEEQRALAPIRWSKPSSGTVVALGVWVVGLAVGALVPMVLLGFDPYQAASGGRVAFGMACTVLGALIMVFSAYLLYRKSGSIGAAILAFVPSFVLVVLGVLMATTKLLYAA